MDYKWDIDFGLVPIPPFKSKYPVLFQLSCSILDIPSSSDYPVQAQVSRLIPIIPLKSRYPI